MTNAGIQMFMEKLNHLINCNDNPLINNPSIIYERPQFQSLYEELGSMIQILFIDQHQDQHNLQKASDLKQRFIYAAEEAEYNVDLFLTGVHIRNHGHFPTSEYFKRSLNLDDVRRSLKSVEVEFMSMIMDTMKVGSSPRPEKTLNQSCVPISFSRNSRGSKILLDESFVGLDRDVELIVKRLVEYRKKVDVVSIVGMGGIGKTTLATKVFNDAYVKYHFDVRVWVTISQAYDKRVVLTHILESMGVKLDFEKQKEWRLHELVYRHLMDQRYLIVIDDIWHVDSWDNLKLTFPHGNNGSRILLTSRITEVAKHANSDGFIHHLESLNKEKSWKLLCQKVFHGSEYPEWSIKPGMKIVESCQGLPLAVVVIAGVLAKEAWSEKFWVEIAEKTSLYIVGDQNGCLETLALSYSHLPLNLRECFLYLGGFPEDCEFHIQWLIWLWVAEGFIEQDGNRSLEDIAESYLMDLIDRNLVIVARRSKSNGAIKTCKVHDLVRVLCLRKAKEERFILQNRNSSELSKVKKSPYRPARIFVDKVLATIGLPISSAQNCRSVLFFGFINFFTDDFVKHFRSFVLLRVLDLGKYGLTYFPKGMELLVHLRYLAIWNSSKAGFPSWICNLWNLQTLIYITEHRGIDLPRNISDLVNLRHLKSCDPSNWLSENVFVLPSIEKPMNLQTISYVELGYGVDYLQKCFPYIKELHCRTCTEKQNDFKSLTCLTKLKLVGDFGGTMEGITFPASLKTLTLKKCRLPWGDMSIIESLPNLQALSLGYKAFEGSCWNTDNQEFRQLRFLRLESLNIKHWEAYSRSFPCLIKLEIRWCRDLEDIPLEIGYIATLELIQILLCRHSLGESVRRIEEEQHDLGNYDIKVDIKRSGSEFW